MNELTTEECILRAAEREFLQKGFAAARTTAIAEAAGVTHAMLHYYFRTKERLFDTIINNKMELLSRMMLGSIMADGVDVMEKIEMAITNHLAFIAENPDLPRFFINEIYGNGERMKRAYEFIATNASEVLASLQREIDAAAAQGRIRRVDAAMLLMDILSLNAFPFVAAPLVKLVCGDLMENRNEFVARRRAETIDIIKRKLKP